LRDRLPDVKLTSGKGRDMRASTWIVCLLAVTACGSAASDEDSATDAAGEADATPDGLPDAEDVPETPGDADAEPDGEVAPDGGDVVDGPPDADEDVPEATDAADTEPVDVDPPDGEAGETDGADAPDATDGGGGLEAIVTDAEVWTVIFMGSGSHAVFTLELRNGGGAEVTGFHAVSGKVTGSGGTELFTFTGPAELNVGSTGGPVFDGRVLAGDSATVVGHGSDLGVTLGTRCGEDVTLSLTVAWDGGHSVSLLGPTTRLQCVSK
jgi:hypothetical protein